LSKIRIFHGISGAAGQPNINAKIQRELGYDSQCVVTDQSQGYIKYPADQVISIKSPYLKNMNQFIANFVNEFDVFHFYFRSFYPYQLNRPVCSLSLDLLALRAANKTVIMHYRGSEVRLEKEFQALAPFNYVSDNPDGIFDPNKNNDEAKQNLISLHQAICNDIWVPDIELQTYVPNAKIFPRVINLDEIDYVGISSEPAPLIVHSTTHQIRKGTHYLLAALEELRTEGLKFNFKLIEKLSHNEAKQLYRAADIIVDQLRTGWHGVFALEALALGKPVVTHIRPDLVKNLPETHPFALADPDNIKTVLKKLIIDKSERLKLSRKSRIYVEKFHDAKKVNQNMINTYENLHRENKPIDVQLVLDRLVEQYNTTQIHNVKTTDPIKSKIFKFLKMDKFKISRRP